MNLTFPGPTTPATSHSQAFLAINETPAPTECQQTKDMIKFLVAHISESKTQTKELLESYKPVDKLTAAVHNASVSLAGVERDFSLLREKNKSVSMQYDAMRIQNVILTRKINRLNSEVASSLTVQRPKEPEEVEVKEAPQVVLDHTHCHFILLIENRMPSSSKCSRPRSQLWKSKPRYRRNIRKTLIRNTTMLHERLIN